jgi:hypothetical protein
MGLISLMILGQHGLNRITEIGSAFFKIGKLIKTGRGRG